MPAKTEKQKKFFGAVMGAKKGQKNVSGEAKKVAKELPKKEIKKFLKREDEESTVPMKPDWMNKPKDKFPARKSAKELGKNPTRKTAKQIRGEEDEESVSKQIKKTGKAVIKGPQVKERKKFAPATKIEKSKKSYDRKKETFDEDEEKACWKGYKKKGTKMKGDKKVNNCVKENTETSNISKFVEAILTKNYARANKHLKQAVETKLAKRIQSELNTPLF